MSDSTYATIGKIWVYLFILSAIISILSIPLLYIQKGKENANAKPI